MEEPLTEDLLAELLAAPSPERFIRDHRVGERGLSGYLQQLLAEKGLKRADVVRAAGLNQIFTGARGASRDKLLTLAFALGLTLTEANRLLKAGGANELYCKSRRDAIIIFALTHGYSLQRADEELYRFQEDTIG